MWNHQGTIGAVAVAVILALAAMGAQAKPEDPVKVSENASDKGKTNAADGIETANEARGTPQVEETTETSSSEDEETQDVWW